MIDSIDEESLTVHAYNIILLEPKCLQYLTTEVINYYDICYEAIKKSWTTFKYVKLDQNNNKKYLELLKYVLLNNNDGWICMKYAKTNNLETSMMAVKQNWRALRYIKHQTLEMCNIAVDQDVNSIEYVCNYMDEDGFIIKYDTELCMKCVRKNGILLRFINNQTYDICLEAIKNNIHAKQYVMDKEMLLEIMLNLFGKESVHYITVLKHLQSLNINININQEQE